MPLLHLPEPVFPLESQTGVHKFPSSAITVASLVCPVISLNPQTPPPLKAGLIIIPIVQMKKLRPREDGQHAQGHFRGCMARLQRGIQMWPLLVLRTTSPRVGWMRVKMEYFLRPSWEHGLKPHVGEE